MLLDVNCWQLPVCTVLVCLTGGFISGRRRDLDDGRLSSALGRMMRNLLPSPIEDRKDTRSIPIPHRRRRTGTWVVAESALLLVSETPVDVYVGNIEEDQCCLYVHPSSMFCMEFVGG